MAANTLVMGWWGPLSFLFTMVTLLIDGVQLHRFAQLPEPVGPDPGCRPADPGAPLTRRPQIAMLVLPLLAVGFVVVGPLIAALLGPGPVASP